ncbi:MAG: hypothetical protein U9N87_03260 [Planctomycetota bacterium]|nr:hypothetical protein [Planctomycetota bacterium]
MSENKNRPPPQHRPKSKGGGTQHWVVGDGASLDSVEKAKQHFDADRKRWNNCKVNREVLVEAGSYWLCYPLWLEQVGFWWAENPSRYAAYNALNSVHHRATEMLMEAAEKAGIDSEPLMEPSQWCRQLLSVPETYRSNDETWPMCLEDSQDYLPVGAWESAQRGYATFVRLCVKMGLDRQPALITENSEKKRGRKSDPVRDKRLTDEYAKSLVEGKCLTQSQFAKAKNINPSTFCRMLKRVKDTQNGQNR